MTSAILRNLDIVTMPTEDALLKLEEYKRAVKRWHGAQDKLLHKTYQVLSDGLGVLDLNKAIHFGGVHADSYLPKLAAMRADQKKVFFKRNSEGAGFFSPFEGKYLARRNKEAQRMHLQIELPPKTLAQVEHWSKQPQGYHQSHSAPMPLMPPNIRVKAEPRARHVILWEVEHWEMVPPVDPILLRPIIGSLYAVVDHWDLSPVETMVLGSLLNQN